MGDNMAAHGPDWRDYETYLEDRDGSKVVDGFHIGQPFTIVEVEVCEGFVWLDIADGNSQVTFKWDDWDELVRRVQEVREREGSDGD